MINHPATVVKAVKWAGLELQMPKISTDLHTTVALKKVEKKFSEGLDSRHGGQGRVWTFTQAMQSPTI